MAAARACGVTTSSVAGGDVYTLDNLEYDAPQSVPRALALDRVRPVLDHEGAVDLTEGALTETQKAKH